MNTSRPATTSDERGFLLVGVIMFMLALTILGLSLFALSSYEAQFFGTSAAREQSLQNSESGVEIVQQLLAASPWRLENAQLAVGQFGITSALAYQWRSNNPADTTSTGLVNWDSTMVIVVSARSGGEERTIQARYRPSGGKNPYQQLIASGLGVSYNPENGASSTVTQLAGTVWHPVQSAGDLAWMAKVNWQTGSPVDPSRPPVPDVDAFLLAHAATSFPSNQNLQSHDNPYSFALKNFGSTPRYFGSPPIPEAVQDNPGNFPEGNRYTFYADRPLEITVRGTVVWLVEEGVCFRKVVTIKPDNNAPGTLIIVAKANGRDPGYENRGIWFQGGLVSDDKTKVFLVSDGDIGLTHKRSQNENHEAKAIAIVAGGEVELGGPDSGLTFRLAYHASMDAIATDLLQRGALPALSGGSSTGYAMSSGSWLETTPR